MYKKRLGLLLLTPLACMTVAQAQVSQTTGAVRGTVTSQKKTPIAGATVMVRNVETGYSQTAVTGAKGDYQLPLLPTGAYDITFSAKGMKTLKDLKVRVTLGNATTVNPVMDSAEVSATVAVVATTSDIDPSRTVTMTQVDQKLVEQVPLVSRNFTDMARLTPGVTAGQGSGGTPRLIVEGGRQIFNAVQIDGASNNSAFFNEQRGGVYTPFIFGADTIKELQVVTNGFDVQYGQAGATINAITKGGTNEFTGSALYEMRKTSWSAAPKGVPYDPAGTFNTPTNLQRFNDSTNINFNVGGPIIKDKLYYFVGVERFHKSITSNPIPTPITTAAGMTQADFDRMYNSRLGHIVTNKSGLTLDNEFGNPGQGISAHPYPMENTNTVYFARLDYSLNANHRFVLRTNYQNMTDTLTNTSAVPNNAESNNIPTRVQSISWVLEANDIWTPELFTESRIQFAREARPMTGNAYPGTPSISIPQSTSFMAFGTKTSTPRESNELTTQFYTSTTWNRGDWQVKGGFDLTKVDEDNQFFQNNAGAWNFGTYGSAADWANGVLAASPNNGSVQYNGAVSAYSGRIPMTTKWASVFAQGQYSGLLDHRLLLTAGFRTLSQSFSDNPHPNPNFAGLDQGMGGHTIDPRFAFSFDVDGKGKTVVRGGLGYFTSPTPLLLHSNTMTGNGQIITNYSFSLNRANATNLALFNSGLLSANNVIGNTTNMRKLSDAELATLASGTAFTAGSSPTSLWDPTNKLSRSRKISIGVEHDLGNNLTVGLTASYVNYYNLQRFENINLTQTGGSAYNDGYAPGINAWSTATRPGTATIRGRVVNFGKGSVVPGNPVGGFSDVYLVKADGYGFYRGLSASVKKTWAENLGLLANVTWSKAQDTGSFERGTYTSAGNYSSELGASLTPDPQDVGSNFGYGDSDRRWVANVVAYFPIVLGIEGSVRGLFNTGLPFTAYDARNLNGDGMINKIYAGHVRNDMRQPNYTQFDIRLTRTFQVYKTVRVQGIVDVYNLFNKADFQVPTGNYQADTSTGAPSLAFGQLATVDKNRTREMQIGIKAIW